MGTTKSKSNGANKPRQEFNAINQLALKAQGLAAQHAAPIGARLSPTFLTAFAADIAALGAAVPAALTSKHGKIQLTAAQSAALAGGYALVRGLRTTVKAHTTDNDVLLAYGVGRRINPLVVKDVTAALQTILDRVNAQPAEAAAFDIVADDTKAVQSALDAVAKADAEQEAARVSAPKTTKERNEIAHRLLDGVKKIAGAGMRTFVDDPAVFATFEALVAKKAA